MDWIPEDPPEGSDVVEVAQHMIMRKPLRAASFGHLLRDNMRALAELAGYFGIPMSTVQWIPHKKEEDGIADEKVLPPLAVRSLGSSFDGHQWPPVSQCPQVAC